MPVNVPEWVSIAVTLLSGGIVAYGIRQFWSGYKLKKALKSEIHSMKGLENCMNSMVSRQTSPSNKPLTPSDVPPVGSIPTNIYEANIGQLGLLRRGDLSKIVEFYSDVLRYKAIIASVRAGEDIPEADENDFYTSIQSLEERRQSLFGENWMQGDEQESVIARLFGRILKG